MKQILQLNKGIFLLFGLILTLSSYAQTGTIKGVVRDERGLLTGASVTVGNRGTTTNENGVYELKVSPGRHTVSITYAGYQLFTTQVNVSANETATADATLVSSAVGEEIVLVGSRSAGRSKLTTPVPVDVIPIAQVINDIGQVDLNQILNFIAPSFQSSRQTVADGTDHLDPAQLRGLGSDQVLVLINGKRRHQSALVNVNGTVNRGQVSTDLSAIPATAIERIEILRDGASAQYGSDAIAGVINIVLKKKTGILEAGISGGQYRTEYPKNYALFKVLGKADDPNVKVNDGGTVQASIGYGFKISRGYLSLTGEMLNRQSTNRTGTYTAQVYPSVNGVNKDDSIMAARGTTRNTFDIRAGSSSMTSGALFFNFGYPAGNNGEFYAFGGYSRKRGNAAGLYRYATGIPGNATIYANQVFSIYPNGFLPVIATDIKDFSASAGFRTKFNSWSFDISNTYGINNFDFGVRNSLNYTQFAVTANPQTSFDAGGLKFFQNTVNADMSKKFSVLAGLNFAFGAEYRIDGFGIRSGEEASYKNYDVNSKAASAAQVFPGFIDPLGGNNRTRNVMAVYVDVEQDLTKNFLVTGALRYEDYSDFGSTFNYKFSSRYNFGDRFSLRGSVSTGFRAPSQQQKYYAKTNTLFISGTGGLVPVQAGTFTNDSKLAELLGIPKLKEETSHNYSVGFTAKPFSGLEVTVDAYQINIKDRIIYTNNFTGAAGTPIRAILDAAGASTAAFFTNAIDTKAKGLEAVIAYIKRFGNRQSLRTTLAMTFIDNEVVKDANGKPVIHASPLLLSGGQIGNYFNREDQSRVEVANPKNKLSLAFNYKYSRFSAMLRFVRFGQVVYLDPSIDPANPAAFPVNVFTGQKQTQDQTFSPKTVTDLSLSYEISDEVTATIGANNLFDVYPDMQAHSNNQSLGRFVYSRRVEQQGFNGAYYFARLKLNLDTSK